MLIYIYLCYSRQQFRVQLFKLFLGYPNARARKKLRFDKKSLFACLFLQIYKIPIVYRLQKLGTELKVMMGQKLAEKYY